MGEFLCLFSEIQLQHVPVGAGRATDQQVVTGPEQRGAYTSRRVKSPVKPCCMFEVGSPEGLEGKKKNKHEEGNVCRLADINTESFHSKTVTSTYYMFIHLKVP